MTLTGFETAGGCIGDRDALPGSDAATRMKATSSGIMVRQRPDAPSGEPINCWHPPRRDTIFEKARGARGLALIGA